MKYQIKFPKCTIQIHVTSYTQISHRAVDVTSWISPPNTSNSFHSLFWASNVSLTEQKDSISIQSLDGLDGCEIATGSADSTPCKRFSGVGPNDGSGYLFETFVTFVAIKVINRRGRRASSRLARQWRSAASRVWNADRFAGPTHKDRLNHDLVDDAA